MLKRKVLGFALTGLLVFGVGGVSFAEELFVNDKLRDPKEEELPDEIVVKFKERVSEDLIRKMNTRHGTIVRSRSERGRFHRLRIPQNKPVDVLLKLYRKDPNVDYAEPNFLVHATLQPNDPLFNRQWNMDNGVYGGIRMKSAWDLQTGNSSVIVAVVDTGVAFENYGNFLKAPDFANTVFVPGYDYVNNDSHPNDDNSHGTHVAGTIAQSTDNALGVSGVAFNASIMPVKVLGSSGSGTSTNVANGIYYAADHGADVINLSLGSTSSSLTIKNALAYAYNAGVTIVCSAGNGYQSGNFPNYPAAFNEYCIAVGATRYNQSRSYYSNTGSYLDLVAPGGDTTVDQNGDGYGDGVLQQTFNPNTQNPQDFGYWYFQGTSMAAPHVSGVAALLIASGVTGPDNVRTALQTTAEDLGTAGWDSTYGWGLVDAYAALSAVVPPPPVSDVAVTNLSAPLSNYRGDNVSVTATLVNQGDFNESFAVTLRDTVDAVEIGSQPLSLPPDGTANVTFNWYTASSSLGNHNLLAEASVVPGETDTADNTWTTTVTVQEPIHDAAVIALDAPSSATQGNQVSVLITVENQGTFAETATVSLNDQTAGSLIGSQSVSLNPGASTVVTVNWNTTGASIGDHLLQAQVDAVVGETDTADNAMSATTALREPLPGPTLSVSNIQLSVTLSRAKAYVWIVDGSGKAVGGATVTGSWTFNGAPLNTFSGLTSSSGKASGYSNRVSTAKSGDVFRLTITNITKNGYAYYPAGNTETSDSITVP